MLFFSFYNSLTEFLFGISSFIFLGFACFFSSCVKISKGLNELFVGLFLLFLSSFFYKGYDFFSYYGVSFQILTFISLFFIICSTLLFLMASSEILLNKELSLTVEFVFISICLILNLYVVFILNDNDFVKDIQNILPMIGLTYLFLSFISKQGLRKQFGFVLAAMVMVGFLEQISLNLFLNVEFSFLFTLLLIFMLSASYFVITADFYGLEKDLIQEKNAQMRENIDNIIKSSPFPILISRLTDDTIVFANQSALKLFELNLPELSRYHFKEFFVDEENRKILLEKLQHKKEISDFEVLVKTSIGQTPFWLMLSANVINYESSMALYCAFQDITSRKQRENMLQNQANRDPLTAVYNRRYFEKTIADRINSARLQKQNFAVLMIDADYFKNVNDKYGHKTGDKVLMELAHILEHSLRPEDVVARYGGEEFIVFLNNVNSDVAEMVANRLRESISNAVVYSENTETVTWTVSIGVAPSGISDSVGAMIKMADDAMYFAKQKGRNRVELYNPENFKDFKKNTVTKEQTHPVFAHEEEQEISLLDGIEANHMIED